MLNWHSLVSRFDWAKYEFPSSLRLEVSWQKAILLVWGSHIVTSLGAGVKPALLENDLKETFKKCAITLCYNYIWTLFRKCSFKCMDFLALRRSFSTKIQKKFFFWPKPFYYLPWHGFEGWFGEKVPGSGPGSRFKRAYLKKGRFWGEKVSALRGYKMVKFWDFWPEIWYGPMIPPLFLTFGKKNWSRVTFTK